MGQPVEMGWSRLVAMGWDQPGGVGRGQPGGMGLGRLVAMGWGQLDGVGWGQPPGTGRGRLVGGGQDESHRIGGRQRVAAAQEQAPVRSISLVLKSDVSARVRTAAGASETVADAVLWGGRPERVGRLLSCSVVVVCIL